MCMCVRASSHDWPLRQIMKIYAGTVATMYIHIAYASGLAVSNYIEIPDIIWIERGWDLR